MFINLLRNAAQAIGAGKDDQHEIRCTSAFADGWVRVTIADTGCAMPESVRSRIFEPFFSTKPRDQGSGLGLTLCADIVRRHSGEILVKSETGKGSVFDVLLPAVTGARPQGKAVGCDPPRPQGRIAGATSATRGESPTE